MIPEHQHLDPEIERTLDALMPRHPAFIAHERFVRERLAELAHRAWQHGMSAARLDLYTSADAANQLGVSHGHLKRLVANHDIGWKAGRDRVLRSEDIARLRAMLDAAPKRRPRSGTPSGASS